MKVRGSFGTTSSGFDLNFTEPWLFDYPVSFGFDGYKHVQDQNTDEGYAYDQDVVGGDLRLGRELTEYLRADLMYKLENINIKNVVDNASNDLKKESGKNTISSFTGSLAFDDRDSVFEPRKGNYLVGSAQIAGGALGGDKNFWKFFGRASHYFPLPRNSVLEVRGRVGVGQAFGSSDDIPIYERFFAGGAYTIRGYNERKVGPVDPATGDPLGGDALLVGNIEYTYPLFSFLKGAVFYDMGNVWAKSGDFSKGGYKSGFGFGIRVKTPVGPLMLDYGIPLNKEPGSDERKSGMFHFSASHGF